MTEQDPSEMDDINRCAQILSFEFKLDPVGTINCLDKALKMAGIPEESALDKTE